MIVLDLDSTPVRAGVDDHGPFIQIGDGVRLRGGWLDAVGFARRAETASWDLRLLEQAQPARLAVPGAPGTAGWT